MLARYRTFADRAEPDAYERTLPEVFPDTAPGNFTWVPELDRWVWTTFNAYQWDLDYTNPDVFVAMTEVMLNLANVGHRRPAPGRGAVPVEAPGDELPEPARGPPAPARVPRGAADRRAGGRASRRRRSSSPADLVRYLDSCDLAYHNSLMVLLWSALASGKVALLTSTLRRMPPAPPRAGWVTYVRCHDDIGWAVTEQDAAAVGEDGYLHRRFLSDFYAGEFPGSFARGARFQPDPRTGEARTSGMTASLAGLERADDAGAGDPADPAPARDHVRLRRGAADLHGRRGGAAQRRGLAADPAHADDNRWLHRPPMDWDGGRAPPRPGHGRRPDLGRHPTARAGPPRDPRRPRPGRHEPIWTGNEHVFGLCREHAGARLLVLANFTAAPQPLHLAPVHERGLTLAPQAAEPDGRPLAVDGDFLVLAPYQHIWVLD